MALDRAERCGTEFSAPDRVRQQLAARPAHLGVRRVRWRWRADRLRDPGRSLCRLRARRYGIINELWVRDDQRSIGVGAEVIAFVRRFARQRGWQRVDVSAPQDPKWDRSVAFCRRQGLKRGV